MTNSNSNSNAVAMEYWRRNLRYNPLINYTWSSLPIASDYVTDGVELITNGGFDDGLNGWDGYANGTSTRVIVNGELTMTSPDNDDISIQQDGGSSKLKLLTFNVLSISGSWVIYSGAITTTISEIGSYRFEVSGDGYLFRIKRASSGNVTIDNISVQKVIQEPNKRYLTDSGASPKYNAEMNFGRGVKFNGVDQSVDMNEIHMTNNSSISLTAKKEASSYFIGSVGGSFIYSTSTDTRFRYNYSTILLFNYAMNVGVEYDLKFVVSNTEVSLYVNGNFIETIGHNIVFNGSNPFQYVAFNNSTHYNCSVRNIIAINQALTPAQIQYQYNNPEKFLYREDNILKSQILNQSEIDNVVAYLPMCEVGSDVTDLVSMTTYPIINYTDSCRSEAINLPYGLQTSSWKRDILGVPYAGSFDALQMDGLSVPALKIPMTDTELWEDEFFQIEMVVKREVNVTNKYLLRTSSNAEGMQLLLNGGTGYEDWVSLRLYDGVSSAQTALGGVNVEYHHIVFTVNATDMYITVGGVKGSVATHSFAPSGLSFADSTQASPTGQLRLFKIHKEYQDETELYNQAVSKGLLND